MFQKSSENRATLVQKSTKMDPKIDQNRSQGPLGELWRPSWPQDGSKSQHRLQNLVRWTPLDVEVGGQNPQNRSEADPKCDDFFTYFLDRFLERFGANLVPTWLPKPSQNGAKLASKAIQKASKQNHKNLQKHVFLQVNEGFEGPKLEPKSIKNRFKKVLKTR